MREHPWKKDEFLPEISDLIGRIFNEVAVNTDQTEMRFICDEGTFVFYHNQDCCEDVSINDIVGNLNDLVGSPILRAEESVSEKAPEGFVHEHEPYSETWTFYKFATIKGYVDVRWVGESNGYYSEEVDLRFERAGA